MTLFAQSQQMPDLRVSGVSNISVKEKDVEDESRTTKMPFNPKQHLLSPRSVFE